MVSDNRWLTSLSPFAVEKPRFDQLQHLEGADGRVVKVIQRAAAKWKYLATALKFEGGAIDAAQLDTANSPNPSQDACRVILQKWWEGAGRKPVNWMTLVQALEEAGCSDIAADLKKALRQ